MPFYQMPKQATIDAKGDGHMTAWFARLQAEVSEREARERLNAAAPEMLKALEGICRNAAIDDSWLAPVRAAIAKATGPS
jgi:hypothetical protein